jgi:PadR family transcriptional regulator, regulatory protein PadR
MSKLSRFAPALGVRLPFLPESRRLTSPDLFYILEDTRNGIDPTSPRHNRQTAKSVSQQNQHNISNSENQHTGKQMTTLKQTEQVVMLAILRKQPDAYGVSIFEELEQRLGKAVPMATIYATLDALEKKGFVKSKMGEATAERGGRAKMFFEITGKGQATLNASLGALDRLRQGTKLAGAMA